MENVRPFRALTICWRKSRALGRLEAGIHPENVANQYNVHRSKIFRLHQRHRATGTVSDRSRSGRPKCTTQREDRYIVVTLARRRFVDGPSLERMLRQQRGPCAHPILVQTVRNRVRTSGVKARRPARKPQLSQRHRALRRQFCKRHGRWNRTKMVARPFLWWIQVLSAEGRRSHQSLASQ